MNQWFVFSSPMAQYKKEIQAVWVQTVCFIFITISCSKLNLDDPCISFYISKYFIQVQQLQLRAKRKKPKTQRLRKLKCDITSQLTSDNKMNTLVISFTSNVTQLLQRAPCLLCFQLMVQWLPKNYSEASTYPVEWVENDDLIQNGLLLKRTSLSWPSRHHRREIMSPLGGLTVNSSKVNIMINCMPKSTLQICERSRKETPAS